MNPIKQGMKAFNRCQKQGKHYFFVSNPFPEGTPKYREFEFGYSKAYFGNLEKVKKREQFRAGS